MAHYKNADLGVEFDVPDQLTVRQQLAYYSAGLSEASWMENMWYSALTLISNWKSELIPDPKTLGMGTVQPRKVVNAIVWASTQVSRHLNTLETVPPNS